MMAPSHNFFQRTNIFTAAQQLFWNVRRNSLPSGRTLHGVGLFVFSCMVWCCGNACNAQQLPMPIPVRPVLIIQEEEEALFQQGAFPQMTRQGLRESLFSGLGGSEAAFQKSRREKIRREIDRVHTVCSLTAEQMEKLDIAIDIDIQHLLNKIETVLSKHDSKMTVQQFQQIQTEVQQIVGTLPSTLQEPEIWRKVLQSQLTESQRDLLAEDARMVAQNADRTEQMGLLLRLQRKLGLVKSQREKLAAWLSHRNYNERPFSAILEELEASTEFEWTPAQLTNLRNRGERMLLPPDSMPLVPLMIPR
jgi:hypothetical protein